MPDHHEDLNYKTLRKLQQAEQGSSVLTKIPISFYQDLSAYIKNLDQSVQKEKNPLKLKLFTDETVNTKKIATSIYELREKKIVQAALATARGATPDLSNMLDIEKRLYTSLDDQIKISRKEIFEEPGCRPQRQPPPSTPDIQEPKTEPNTHPIVRVMQDTPQFVGTDEKTYSLRKEDVLSLPNEMAEPLLKRGVVQQVK
jgi:DNA replication initiation complex subunit (GINS family)